MHYGNSQSFQEINYTRLESNFLAFEKVPPHEFF